MSKNFQEYQFFEKKSKPISMNSRFKTNKTLTAIKKTKHTVTTSDGRTIHKKQAFNPIKFQPSKKLNTTKSQQKDARDVAGSAMTNFAIPTREQWPKTEKITRKRKRPAQRKYSQQCRHENQWKSP